MLYNVLIILFKIDIFVFEFKQYYKKINSLYFMYYSIQYKSSMHIDLKIKQNKPFINIPHVRK